MTDQTLSDGALSILTFAAYHSLISEETVRDVVLDDGAGHHADSQGVEELKSAGMLEVEGQRARLTEDGSAKLAEVLEAIRGAGAPSAQ